MKQILHKLALIMNSMILRLFILFSFTAQFCNAQNLVYNGSFDEITQCNSNKFLYYDYVVGWVNPCNTNGHSSDYYNTTCPPIPNMDKLPYHGSGLFGLATYSNTQTYPSGITNFHEFVRGTLTTPLTVGTTYCVSFKVAAISATFASDKIGALFTSVPYDVNNPYEALTNNAHVFSTTVITDTNWTTVNGSFVADSAYQYIMLGNFFADNVTNHVSGGAYYWIDDVWVVLDPNGDCSGLIAPDTTYNISQDLTICPNETVTLPNGTVVNTGGIYIDTLLASNGADSIVTTTLNVLTYVTSTINASICDGSQYNFDGNLLTTSGIYTANIPNPNGCDSVITLNLEVMHPPSKPEVTTNLPILCENQEFIGEILNPNAAFTYQWYIDTNSTTIGQGAQYTTVINENTLTIYVNATNGTCSSAFTIISIIANQAFNTSFEMPNVITPNNDGINDEIDFDAFFGNCFKYEISIFNRWGNLIFKDGKVFNGKNSKGSDLVDGTYFYMLTYNGNKQHGFLQVVR